MMKITWMHVVSAFLILMMYFNIQDKVNIENLIYINTLRDMENSPQYYNNFIGAWEYSFQNSDGSKLDAKLMVNRKNRWTVYVVETVGDTVRTTIKESGNWTKSFVGTNTLLLHILEITSNGERQTTGLFKYYRFTVFSMSPMSGKFVFPNGTVYYFKKVNKSSKAFCSI